MRKFFSFAVALLLCSASFAQVEQVVGDWKTVDDKTGANYSIIHIFKATDGLYYGRIAQMLVGPADLVCEACTGADKDKPLQGLVIIRGMHEENGELRGGKVLDPESGKFYYGKIYLKDGKLVLRGSLDKRGLLGRNQTWLRAD